MKHTKYYLILSVLIVVLSVPAMPRTELPPFREPQPGLIARPHPELGRIDMLHVTIVPSGAKTNKQDPLWKDLKAKVESSLDVAGIDVIAPSAAGSQFRIPELRIHAEMLKLEDSNQYIFMIQTSLSRMVYLDLPPQRASDMPPKLYVKADLWKKSSPMKVAAAQHTLAAITDVVLHQTEAFVATWTAANPPDKQTSDARVVAIIPEKPTDAPVESLPAKYPYLASKNSKVFHVPNCRSAKRISPENRVLYESRNEAVNDAKRPCKLCKP